MDVSWEARASKNVVRDQNLAIWRRASRRQFPDWRKDPGVLARNAPAVHHPHAGPHDARHAEPRHRQHRPGDAETRGRGADPAHS